MSRNPKHEVRAAVILAAAALTLSACDDNGIDRVLAEGGESYPADYVDRTFPVYFARADQEGSGSTSDAGVGSARFITTSEVEVALPGEPTRTYTRVGTTNEFAASGAPSLFIGDVGSFILASNLDTSGPEGGIIAYAGFETPVANRPALARYNASDFGVLFLAGPDFPDIDTLTCSDCVDLLADFNAGTIEGPLFSGNTDTADGNFAVANTLVDGEITNTGFNGDIDVGLVFTPTGGSAEALDPTLSNQNVVGRFFGSTGDQATVVYESDFSVTAGTETINGSLAGAADAFDSLLLATE